MARIFDGTDDEINLSVGAIDYVGPMSFAAIVRRPSTGTGHSIFAVDWSSTGTRWCVGILGDNLQLLFPLIGDSVSSFTFTSSDGWVFVGVDIPATAAEGQPRWHLYKYATNAWTHQTTGNAMDAPSAHAGPNTALRLGSQQDTFGEDFLDIDTLIVGTWNRRLSDAEYETLPFSLQPWHASVPKGLWLLDQSSTGQLVGDLTGGGANQSSITGTAVATTHPPIWNRYGDAPVIATLVGQTIARLLNESVDASDAVLALRSPTFNRFSSESIDASDSVLTARVTPKRSSVWADAIWGSFRWGTESPTLFVPSRTPSESVDVSDSITVVKVSPAAILRSISESVDASDRIVLAKVTPETAPVPPSKQVVIVHGFFEG